MADRGELLTLLQYYIDHNKEHAAELVDLGAKLTQDGLDAAQVLAAAGLMQQAVACLEKTQATLSSGRGG